MVPVLFVIEWKWPLSLRVKSAMCVEPKREGFKILNRIYTFTSK